jgi:putative intracellular protease/amidase
MGSTGHHTGVWLEELATPYYALLDGGTAITLASVRGGEIPFDPRSMPAHAGQPPGEQPAEQQDVPASVHRFLADVVAMNAARNSLPVDALEGESFDAILLSDISACETDWA